jgi:aspartate carbamoyltransferase regulatory subunit
MPQSYIILQWLRHYATIRKVAGSIPDEVIGFFNCPNPSRRTVGLGFTQSLTETSKKKVKLSLCLTN